MPAGIDLDAPTEQEHRELFGKLASALKALISALGEATLDDGDQGSVSTCELRNRRRLLVGDSEHHGVVVVGLERHTARDQLVEACASAPQIAAQVDVFAAAGLLGRHVVGRAADDPSHRDALLVSKPARYSEIEELGLLAAVWLSHQENVGGLQVAMHDALGMR